MWRKKNKAKVTSLVGVDFEADGAMHMCIGFADGMFEVKTHNKGANIYSETFETSLAKIMYSDYRLEGSKQIICANIEGDIKGFSITANRKLYELQDTTEKVEQDKVNHLAKQKN